MYMFKMKIQVKYDTPGIVASVYGWRAASGIRHMSSWGTGTGLFTDGDAGAARREASHNNNQLMFNN